MAESCIAVLFTQLRVIAIFEYNKFSQCSVKKTLRCGGIFNYMPEI